MGLAEHLTVLRARLVLAMSASPPSVHLRERRATPQNQMVLPCLSPQTAPRRGSQRQRIPARDLHRSPTPYGEPDQRLFIGSQQRKQRSVMCLNSDEMRAGVRYQVVHGIRNQSTTQKGKSVSRTQSPGYKGDEVTDSHQVQLCGRAKRTGPHETRGYEKPSIMVPRLLVH